MDIHDKIKAIVPRAPDDDIARWIEGGIAYADRLKLPARERDAVAQLFVLHGLAPDTHYKHMYRAAIDVLIAPFYPAVGAVDAPAT